HGVVRVAPRVWTVAGRERAVSIACDERFAHPSRHNGSLPAYIQHLGAASGDDSRDRGVAGDAAGCLGGDGADVLQLGTATSALESLEVQVHADVGPFPGDIRAVGSIQRLPADLPERIRPALGGGAHVALPT